jgi:hypothetical protein
MKTLLLTLSLFFTTLSCVAAEKEAFEAAKTHVTLILAGNVDELENSYTEVVTLMPGHLFLNPEHGLVEKTATPASANIERGKFIDAINKMGEGHKRPPMEKVRERVETLTFEQVEVTEGDFVTDPSKQVDTLDGKLHFTIEKGDKLYKISLPDGNFLLLQLRLTDDDWRVTAEYLAR